MNNKTFRKIWKGFWQPILKCGLIQWIIAGLMALAIWIVYFTSWRTIQGKEIIKNHSKKSAIFVFWHGRSMMLSPIRLMLGGKGYAVSSRHADGRMMAKLQQLFGLSPIYGSTSEGGISVLREGVRILRGKKHCIVCLSPDGPSGPSLRVKDGALYFAKMSGAPIIPVCFSSNSAWLQNRWDRYLVALPFSHLKCIIGEPIYIDSKLDKDGFEKARQHIEDVMVKQLRDLDAEFNLYQVEQDATATEFKQARREERAKQKQKK